MDKYKQKRMTEELKQKHEENMALPINQFLNMKEKDGKFKYPLAEKLRKYFVNNPDPVLNDMRLSNALLHQVRWHKEQAFKYRKEYESPTDDGVKDRNGVKMERADLYLAYISDTQNIHIALSKLREHLVSKLLAKCDGEVFTLYQYDDFVRKTEQKVSEMGYELFPVEVEIIEPL